MPAAPLTWGVVPLGNPCRCYSVKDYSVLKFPSGQAGMRAHARTFIKLKTSLASVYSTNCATGGAGHPVICQVRNLGAADARTHVFSLMDFSVSLALSLGRRPSRRSPPGRLHSAKQTLERYRVRTAALFQRPPAHPPPHSTN